jgi:carbonic anhydrase
VRIDFAAHSNVTAVSESEKKVGVSFQKKKSTREKREKAIAGGQLAEDGGTAVLDAFDFAAPLPTFIKFTERQFVIYDGSFTTPPCDEPVQYYVFEQIKEISEQQFEALIGQTGANNRPSFSAEGRNVVRGPGSGASALLASLPLAIVAFIFASFF